MSSQPWRLTFKLAKTEPFKQLQHQIIKNCKALTDRLTERGFHMPFGGTNTHLTNLDCKSIIGPDGTPLSGDMAARILDIAGLVMNRNTIPGDKTALNASGIRMGTPWMTQRGLVEIRHGRRWPISWRMSCKATTPYSVDTRKGWRSRAKVDFRRPGRRPKLRVRSLAEKAGIDYRALNAAWLPAFLLTWMTPVTDELHGSVAFDLSGAAIRSFRELCLCQRRGSPAARGEPAHPPEYPARRSRRGADLSRSAPLPVKRPGLTRLAWRRPGCGICRMAMSHLTRIPFAGCPARCMVSRLACRAGAVKQPANAIGQPEALFHWDRGTGTGKPLPRFTWEEKEGALRRTPLYETHRQMGRKDGAFAGWEMPVWYTSVVEEHLATRQAAGLFDVSHMGVYQVEGPDAAVFLDSVCGNDIAALAVGESVLHPFPRPGCQCDRRHAGLPPRRRVPGGGQCLQRR